MFCAQEGFSVQFKSSADFRKHLNSCHSTVNMVPDNDVDNETPHQSDLGEQNSEDGFSNMDLDVINQSSTSYVSKDQAKEMFVSIIAKLQGSGTANIVVLSVAESMEEYVNEVHANFKEQVLSAVPTDSPHRSSVEEVFSNIFNPVCELNTNSKWTKYFSEKWGVVDLVEVHLGVRYDSKINKIS